MFGGGGTIGPPEGVVKTMLWRVPDRDMGTAVAAVGVDCRYCVYPLEDADAASSEESRAGSIFVIVDGNGLPCPPLWTGTTGGRGGVGMIGSIDDPPP